jgi:pimeloyl-ACP methyl ester carboxylesterase
MPITEVNIKMINFQELAAPTRTVSISLEAQPFLVEIYGNGPLPCLCVGTGILVARTLTPAFLKMFTVYAVDLYFAKAETYKDIPALTMEKIAAHQLEVAKQLNLKKYIVLGFSCFGILALEMAKQDKNNINAVLLISSPPQWNDSSIAFTQHYFENHATPERIANDKLRKQHYEKIKKPTDSEVSVERYIADAARYWGDFTISNENIRLLWHKVECNDDVINQFFLITLPQYNLADSIEQINIPVLLLGGECDYDSIPLVQWEKFPKPNNFNIVSCGPVGHWPQLENPSSFDQAIACWVQEELHLKVAASHCKQEQ